MNVYDDIRHRNPLYTLTTATSLSRRGVVFESKSAGGSFAVSEAIFHKSDLKLRVVIFGLKSFCRTLSDTYNQVQNILGIYQDSLETFI